MEKQDEALRERLMARLPQPEKLEEYREEVESLLTKSEKSLRGKRWTVVRMWVFVVLISLPFLWMAGSHFNTAEGNWFLGIVGFWVLLGAIEVSKYEGQQGKLEVLKEVKQLQLQVLEVQAMLSAGAKDQEA